MPDQTYQIRIELLESSPKIWRRLLVNSEVLLSDFHNIIQTTMGWTNSHLHQFVAEGQYLEPPAEYDFWDESVGEDYSGMQLKEFLLEKGDKMFYEYDFGDGWRHEIKLESIIGTDKETVLPKCIAGAMACPPEDIGGMWGYQDFLKAMKSKKHPNRKMYEEWYGDNFDPEHFDMQQINESLKMDNFGVLDW